MILIDRHKPVQSILLTLDEIAGHSGLRLRHDSTRKEYEIALGDNVSPYPSRYDLFHVPTSAFADMAEGYYSYTVADYFGNVIESGKLLIKPISAEAIPAAKIEDNYLVFTPKK